MRNGDRNPRERLVFHVQELERVELLKHQANECVRDAMDAAKAAGYDPSTLRVVLKLRKMTAEQRRERRALEAIYMAALGMLEGEALPDAARRRLDEPEQKRPDAKRQPDAEGDRPDGEQSPGASSPPEAPPTPPQAPLVLKTPEEAKQEGMDAAAAGKRVYENPYPAGDPCRAAWDEGWCAQSKSHGMDTPAAFQRRTAKPPDKTEKPEKDGKSDGAGEGDEKGAS